MGPKKQFNFQQAFKDITIRLDDLEEKFQKEVSNIKDIVIARLQNDNEQLREKVRIMENKLEVSLQYERRSNVVIDGLPADLNEDLENAAIKLFNSIDVNVVKEDIVACHPLKSKKDNPPVIIKFLNRKHAHLTLQNKSKLKTSDKSFLGEEFNQPIYLNENLTPFYSNLAWKCRSLQRKGHILSSSVFREKVKIYFENGDIVEIRDGDHIGELFPNFEF